MLAVITGSDVFCGGGDTVDETVETYRGGLPCPADLKGSNGRAFYCHMSIYLFLYTYISSPICVWLLVLELIITQ